MSAVLAGAVLSSCGTPGGAYTPVERHLVRVPAHETFGISSIDRANWLNAVRKNPESLRSARDGRYVFLPATQAPGSAGEKSLEVKFFPLAAGGQDGLLALHWFPAKGKTSGETLTLLSIKASNYTDTTLTSLPDAAHGAASFKLSPTADTLTCVPAAGAAVPLRWNGSKLVAR